MRIIATFLLFFAGDALAAGDGASTGRLDFANTPAFHSVFDTRVPWADTARTGEAQSTPGISSKMRIAMWTTSSELPSRTETLTGIPPSPLPRGQALQEIMPEPPKERITTKTLRTASLEESPPTRYRVPKRTRIERQMVIDSPDTDDDAPSAYQRRALSNASDVDEDAQPSYLGRHGHPAPSDEGDDAQPTLLGRLFGALFPW